METLNEWKEAVLNELGICCMDAPLTESPRSILKRIIDWHVAVALDPAVSEAAEDLIQRGRSEALEGGL